MKVGGPADLFVLHVPFIRVELVVCLFGDLIQVVLPVLVVLGILLDERSVWVFSSDLVSRSTASLLDVLVPESREKAFLPIL